MMWYYEVYEIYEMSATYNRWITTGELPDIDYLLDRISEYKKYALNNKLEEDKVEYAMCEIEGCEKLLDQHIKLIKKEEQNEKSEKFIIRVICIRGYDFMR